MKFITLSTIFNLIRTKGIFLPFGIDVKILTIQILFSYSTLYFKANTRILLRDDYANLSILRIFTKNP